MALKLSEEILSRLLEVTLQKKTLMLKKSDERDYHEHDTFIIKNVMEIAIT